MNNPELFAAALSQLLRHELADCRRAARHAAGLLDRLVCEPGLDAEMRRLCEEKSRRLTAMEPPACA